MTQRIVDAHVHWRDPVSNPYEPSLTDVYLPDDYFQDADRLNIEGFVHVEAEWLKSDPVGETKWLDTLEQTGATRELPYVIIGHADLTTDGPTLEAVLDGHSTSSRMRGIRHFLNYIEGRSEYCWAPQNFLENPLWRKNYALLSKYNMDFDLMCFAHQMLEFAPIAATNDKIAVHLEHCGMPWDHSPDGIKLWRKGMKTLAELPHVDLKISGLGNTVPNWTIESIRSYVLEAIEIFGVERVSFASNFPTDNAFSSMGTIWQAFFDITRNFSQNEKNAMFADNAIRTYCIGK